MIPTESRKKKYQKVVEVLEREIREGSLAPGEWLPSEKELMWQHGASMGTIRRAVDELRFAGLVETRHGSGSFVRPVRTATRRAGGKERTRGVTYLTVKEQPGEGVSARVLHDGPTSATAEVAKQLGVTEHTPVRSRHLLYFHDGIPAERFVMHLLPDITQDPYTVVEYGETVCVRTADRLEAETLDLAPKMPVIQVDRRGFTADGKVAQVSRCVMPADMFVLAYRMPAQQ